MDVLFNDTAKVSTESEAQAPQADSYSTTTRLTVSLQNGTGHSPALSVSTSNDSCSRIISRNQSWASRAVWMP